MEYFASNSKTEQIGFIDSEDFDLVFDNKINLDSEGYARLGKNRLHRIIYQRVINSEIPKGLVIDHKNGNKLDNRRYNLRICTISQNNMNQKKTRGTSIYKGVYWNKSKQKWYSQIKVDSKVKYLGLSITEKEAAIKYNNAAILFHGQYALLNNIK